MCRFVNGKKFDEDLNPGVSVVPCFINEDEEKSLLQEILEMKSKFSFRACDSQKIMVQGNHEHNIMINALRITGRPEADEQIPAPW